DAQGGRETGPPLPQHLGGTLQPDRLLGRLRFELGVAPLELLLLADTAGYPAGDMKGCRLVAEVQRTIAELVHFLAVNRIADGLGYRKLPPCQSLRPGLLRWSTLLRQMSKKCPHIVPHRRRLPIQAAHLLR